MLIALFAFGALPAAHAAPSCEAVFSGGMTEAVKDLLQQIDPAKRRLPPAALISALDQAALAQLQKDGVEFKWKKWSDRMTIQIVPSQASELNKLAQKVETVYGAKIAFEAKKLVENGFGGFIEERADSDGRADTIFFLGARTIFANERLLRDPAILHELRHLRFRLEARQGSTSPLIGTVHSVEGKIPDDKYGEFEIYRKRMHFEELKTYHTQAKESLTLLRQALRNGTDAETVTALLWEAQSAVNIERIISYRTRLMADMAFDAAAKQKYPADSLMNGSYRVEFSNQSGKGTIHIRLPQKEKMRTVEENAAQFFAQLRLLRQVADSINEQTRLAREALKVFDNEAAGLPEKLDAIDRAQKALPANVF